MAREFSRSNRVAELIQRELAVAIQRNQQSDLTGLITLSRVQISPDLKNATVYYTCLGNHGGIAAITESLNEMSGEYRHYLSTKLTMRSVPKLVFAYDETLERANHLTALIDSLHDSRDKNK